jgi:hypothetical protein
MLTQPDFYTDICSLDCLPISNVSELTIQKEVTNMLTLIKCKMVAIHAIKITNRNVYKVLTCIKLNVPISFKKLLLVERIPVLLKKKLFQFLK